MGAGSSGLPAANAADPHLGASNPTVDVAGDTNDTTFVLNPSSSGNSNSGNSTSARADLLLAALRAARQAAVQAFAAGSSGLQSTFGQLLARLRSGLVIVDKEFGRLLPAQAGQVQGRDVLKGVAANSRERLAAAVALLPAAGEL